MRDYLLFIVKNALRSKRRAFLTMASVALSFCLLAVLMALYHALYLAPPATPGQAFRLVVHHKVSLTQDLPLSYERKIAEIAGVKDVTSLRWFGGTYKDARDPRNNFAQFGIEPAHLFNVYPEFSMPQNEIAAFEQQKTACITSRALATKLGWKIGERINLVGTMMTLDLTLVGIFDDPGDTEVLYFNRDYLQDSLPTTDPRNDMVQQYYVESRSKDDVASVASAIDAAFAESPAPTRTESEHAFMLSFVSFVGNAKLFLIAIGGAVTFTILLVSANTISMSVRERIREVGILKTLGFSSSEVLAMILSESAFIGLVGGIVGCAIAVVLSLGIAQAAHHGSAFVQSLRSFSMTPLSAFLTILAALALSVVSALVPALSAARAPIVDSLRHTG
ncbi:MAG TPA: ABC transporter permease [Terracidiphilus sp.]|nr:ABC transporter permease [Terracidiphilus sp.]